MKVNKDKNVCSIFKLDKKAISAYFCTFRHSNSAAIYLHDNENVRSYP